MRAMILAAGLGTRLRPLTERIPKPLLPVGGVPLIVWNLLLLKQYGITEAMINLHYLGNLIQRELGDGEQWGMRISYSPEPILLGTGGGLRAAEAFFQDEDFLVMNSDTIIELNLDEVCKEHVSSQAVATLVLRDDPDVEQWGVVESTHDREILRINGQGKMDLGSQALVRKQMFAGVHLLHPSVLRHCELGRRSHIIDAYVQELKAGSKIMGYVQSGYWSDVGTPERYAQAQEDIETGCLSFRSRLVS
ncbi:MAG: NDP-sugar synthase [Nitrospirales bacterium]|nr:NDP-sugar synthase [Nitrospira sp.]MDR4501755.1 NDP-sugar synthase [Nitrospirales bacterium]